MSTTGHYTRYINQYPGLYPKCKWSDNCDSMYHGIYMPDMHENCNACIKINGECSAKTEEKRIDLCPYKIGHFTIEHTYGNKRAYLTFDYENKGHNYWHWIREQTDYIGPLKPGRKFTLIDYTGKLAIQHVIEESYKVKPEILVDMIFKNEFYNRSYSDYFRYYLNEVEP